MADTITQTGVRNRSRGSMVARGQAVYQNYAGGPYYYTPIATGKLETMIDRITPGWKSRKVRAQPVFNTMLKETQECVSMTTSRWSGMPKAYPNQWDAQMSGDWSFSILQDSDPYVPVTDLLSSSNSDQDRLLAELSTRVLSQIGRSSANSWETLYEIRKTVGMFRHPIDTFWKWYRGNGIATQISRNSVNGYLAWRYGLSPLIRDAGSILVALNRGVRPKWQTTRSSGQLPTITTQQSSYWVSGIHRVNLETQKIQELSARCMSLDTATADLATDLGFEAKSLLTLGWEVVPYSFVADWFINIGDYLGAVVQSFRSGNLGSCTVVTRKTTIKKWSTSHIVDPSWYVVSPSAASITKTRTVVDRSTGLSSPRLVVKADFRFDDITRIADALSLIGQQVFRIGNGIKT